MDSVHLRRSTTEIKRVPLSSLVALSFVLPLNGNADESFFALHALTAAIHVHIGSVLY